MDYKTPGVYIEELSKFPPSIAAVETAIPVFIGYTEKAKLKEDGDLLKKAHRIESLSDYERFFGGAMPEKGIAVSIKGSEIVSKIASPSKYMMYYGMQAFFANGGGPCYIISIDLYDITAQLVNFDDLMVGLEIAGKVDEVTLNVFPDGFGLSKDNYYTLQKKSLDQCTNLKDRFAVMDVFPNNDIAIDDVAQFRNADFGDVNTAKYGATYYPQLDMLLDYVYEDSDVKVRVDGSEQTLTELKGTNNAQYNLVRAALGDQLFVRMPAAMAMVGIYAKVDESRGVWKAPANVNVDFAKAPVLKITDEDQESLNVDVVAGKSINAIRSFTGRGAAIVWGARTLAGNDNEWRYISVRRFFNMVEESVKNATIQFVFEPNDINTWTRVRSMIENFLVLQWRAGALMGTTPAEAFFVKVGLNETMTELDILEGQMIVEIGMAVVRPAEFIILKFSHKMLSES